MKYALRGFLAFGARAVTNTLASPDNLACWGKVVMPKCVICGHIPCTLGHLLSDFPHIQGAGQVHALEACHAAEEVVGLMLQGSTKVDFQAIF